MVWVIITVAALILILLVFFIAFKRKEPLKIDYHSFFIMGVIWLAAGIPLMVGFDSPALFIMGLIFTVVGLAHRKEWGQNIKDRKNRWKKLSKKDKKRLIWFRWVALSILILGVLVIGIVVYFLSKV